MATAGRAERENRCGAAGRAGSGTRRGVLLALASVVLAAARALAAPPEPVGDVPAALQAIADSPRSVEFAVSGDKLPAGGHLQGIQARYDVATKSRTVFISHDSLTEAYFVTARFPEPNAQGEPAAGQVEHVQRLPSDGQSPPLRHAGGIQLLEDVLAIGVEDNQAKLRSQVQFWNVADAAGPRQLSHLTITRENDQPKVATAGAVGLVKVKDRFLLAVGNWDCRAIDFYRSNAKPLADAECRFSLASRWQAEQADTSDWRPDSIRGSYQAINLLRDPEGKLWLLGFETTPDGKDIVDVFEVDLKRPATRILTKVARQPFKLADGCHFRSAGGAAVAEGKLSVLASPRNFAPLTRLSVAP